MTKIYFMSLLEGNMVLQNRGNKKKHQQTYLNLFIFIPFLQIHPS